MQAVHHGAVCRVQRRIVRYRDQLLDRHVLRVIVAALVPSLGDALPPALLKERQERVRSAEQQHLVAERIAAGENREVLHDDRVGQRTHDLVRGDARLHEIDDVGLGEHAALGCDVMKLLVIEVQVQCLFGGHADFDHALVDRGARARRALVVHRRDRGLVARLLVLFEDDDLRVLAAELDDGPGIGVQCLDRQGDGVHLLNEFRAERFREWRRARPRDEGPNVLASELLQNLLDAHHEVENALGLLGVMPLVVTPDDIFGFGVDDNRFHRRGPDVQPYYRSVHKNGCALPSQGMGGKHKPR